MDLVQFISKAVWFVVWPGNLLLLVLLAGTLATWLWQSCSGRIWLTCVTMLLLFVTVAPVDSWIARPLEDRFSPPPILPARIDGILVLGGIVQRSIEDTRGVLAVNEKAERLMMAAALAQQNPGTRVVITGRAEDNQVLASWFTSIGLEAGRIEYEPTASNTYENAILSQRLVRPGPDEVWLLVTSARHMPRAVGVFRKIGWEVVPYPVDYQTVDQDGREDRPDVATNLKAIGGALKEWVGLLAYYLLDRTDELWPAPNRPNNSSSRCRSGC